MHLQTVVDGRIRRPCRPSGLVSWRSKDVIGEVTAEVVFTNVITESLRSSIGIGFIRAGAFEGGSASAKLCTVLPNPKDQGVRLGPPRMNLASPRRACLGKRSSRLASVTLSLCTQSRPTEQL